MKTSIHPRGIHMIGKSWEIRARLREWADSSLTVEQWILRQFPHWNPNHLKKTPQQKGFYFKR